MRICARRKRNNKSNTRKGEREKNMKNDCYESLAEKRGAFDTGFNTNHNQLNQYWKIDSKAQLDDFCAYLNNLPTNAIFRGVCEAKYQMFTSLQMYYKRGKINSSLISPDELVLHEIRHLRQSHGNLLPRYFQSIGTYDTDYTYLSMLQHHRAPTPFLDFSHSYKSALFFATDGVTNNLCSTDIDEYISLYWIIETSPFFINIYGFLEKGLDDALQLLGNNAHLDIDTSILNVEQLLSWKNEHNRGEGLCKLPLGFLDFPQNEGMVQISGSAMKDLIRQFMEAKKIGDEKSAEEYRKQIKFCFRQNCKLTNLNIVAQDGCFILFNTNIPTSLEQYWKSQYPNGMPVLHCANIHKGLVEYIRKMLKNSNPSITNESIYPDLYKITMDSYKITKEDDIK